MVRDWVSLAASIVALGAALWAVLQAPAKRNSAEFAKFREEEFGGFCRTVNESFGKVNTEFEKQDEVLEQLRERMSVTEAVIKQLPDKESVHRLELIVSQLGGDLKAINQKVDVVGQTARRVEEFLLEQAKVR